MKLNFHLIVTICLLLTIWNNFFFFNHLSTKIASLLEYVLSNFNLLLSFLLISFLVMKKDNKVIKPKYIFRILLKLKKIIWFTKWFINYILIASDPKFKRTSKLVPTIYQDYIVLLYIVCIISLLILLVYLNCNWVIKIFWLRKVIFKIKKQL